MEDQYSMADLRQYLSGGGRAFFPPISRPPDVLSGPALGHYPYDMLIFSQDSTIVAPSVSTTANISGGASSGVAAGRGFSGFEMEAGGGVIGGPGGGGGDGGAGRWPRQETLALLEIRSRLDPKFKEANQKGPLWDEVARIMSEEHGYQRTGKKCREKFENLYKYYKKTREGKAGRQDGKHYRFFRQLDALYGENSSNSASISETHFAGGDNFQYNFATNNNTLLSNNNNNQESFLGSSDCDDTTSSDYTNNPRMKKRRGRRSLKAKIKAFIDSQMRKLTEKQEAWMEKMMAIIEHKEQERLMREEQWRKQDTERIEREHSLWAREREWIEARDAELMDAFHKLTRKDNMTDSVTRLGDQPWPESEITKPIQLKNGMEFKFQENGISEEVLWDEIASKMACFGHDQRSGLMCKEKWDGVNNYLLKCNKKRKENAKSCGTYSYQNHEAIYDHSGVPFCETSEHAIRPNINSPGNVNPTNESCFRYFIGDSYGSRIMN